MFPVARNKFRIDNRQKYGIYFIKSWLQALIELKMDSIDKELDINNTIINNNINFNYITNN